MLKFFGRFIIGGRSGKQEQAWAVGLLWDFAFSWIAAKEAAGVAVDGTHSILSLAFPMVIANLTLAHGME